MSLSQLGEGNKKLLQSFKDRIAAFAEKYGYPLIDYSEKKLPRTRGATTGKMIDSNNPNKPDPSQKKRHPRRSSPNGLPIEYEAPF
jgi:hypothetical protein